MPEFQPVSSAAIAAIERPSLSEVQPEIACCSRSLGRDHPASLTAHSSVQKCGRVHTTVVSGDPMNSATGGWLVGELRPPR